MGTFVIGDVVIVLFPFTDGTQGKKRPALVVSTPDDGFDTIIVCQITGTVREDRYTIPLSKSDFVDGGLNYAECAVRPQHLFVIDASLVSYRAGRISDAKLAKIRKSIRLLF